MDIIRITAKWTGFSGAPGYSSFHFAGGGGLISDAQQVTDRVRTAFDEISAMLPAEVSINLGTEAEVLDSETGVIQAFHNVNPGLAEKGTGTGSYAAASGAVVNWRTDDVRFGRRIRGRTFIVPIVGLYYDAQGTLSGGAITALTAFANALVGGDLDSEFGVWSRPRDGAGGVFATATSFSVPDKAAVLRSRRD